MRNAFGFKAGLPIMMRGSPRLSMARATSAGNRRGQLQLVEMEFFTSQVWKIPPGVNRIRRLFGRGGVGSPAYEGVPYYDAYRTTNGGPREYLGRVFDSEMPADYCNSSNVCYTFFYGDTGSGPATAGASATGFGKTFPGGYGGPATPVEYLAVPVSAGADVSLIIPSDGYIKIEFFSR